MTPVNERSEVTIEQAKEALRRRSLLADSWHPKDDALVKYCVRALAEGRVLTESAEDNEWFFRWAARAMGDPAEHSFERAVKMIWHHPRNPYRNNNPWTTQSAASKADDVCAEKVGHSE